MTKDAPWLSVIGLGEDGLNGLTDASRDALKSAEIVMAPPRHLALLGELGGTAAQQHIEWPVPYSDGIDHLLTLRGRRVAVLASGDPFWFGAGTVLADRLRRSEWQSFAAPSALGLACSRLGWRQETLPAFGLHAAPFDTLIPHLADHTRMFCLLRDGDAPAKLAGWLSDHGWGDSTLHICEALGGPRERIRSASAQGFDLTEIAHPVCAAIEVAGQGRAMPQTAGRSEDWFDHDGQITKSPIRALTLAALAPCAGEHLWDLGLGSGSVAIEWLLAHPTTTATGVERDPARAQRATANAQRLGVARLDVRCGPTVDMLDGLPKPDCVFVGGGLTPELVNLLWQAMPQGCRLVANAVTLETEATLANAHAQLGGNLMRVEIAHANPLGRVRGWKSSYPIVQWTVTR
jgi:precorrin-6Y C5,15-methyltransferase (decarboxylating)